MQLETIIAQNQLDDFLSDPEQRRRLGGLSGINALVVGSFVVIGDRLRINARLVGMENGEMMAAEAVSYEIRVISSAGSAWATSGTRCAA